MKKLFFHIILSFTFLILNCFCFAQQSQIDSLFTLLKKDKEDTTKVKHLNALGWLMVYQNPDTAIILGNMALAIISPISSPEFSPTKEGMEDKRIRSIRADIYGNLGAYYYFKADYSDALDYYLKSLKIDEELKNKKGIATQLGNIGLVLSDQGNYPKAFDYYFNALKMSEELGDKNGITRHLANIGGVYLKQTDYVKALDFYFKALKAAEELGNKNYIATISGNIGIIYSKQANYPQALDYHLKALKMAKELGNVNGTARHLGNIGTVYINQGDYVKALKYYFEALNMEKKLENKHGIAFNLSNIGLVYKATGKFRDAEQYLKSARNMNESIGSLDDLRQDEENLSLLYDTIGQYEEALIHYKKSIALKDTIFSQENKKQLIRKEMNFEFDKKEAATKAENEKQQAIADSERKKQQFILILVFCVLVLVFLFAGFIFRSLRTTRKQKNIIELQKNKVLQQKEIVEKQKEKIVDSITYAQRIQQSILLDECEIQNYLPDSFIYYKPKDIVSGDFYWCSKIDDKIIIAAVDCTGHGVAGAFMSMIGNTLLNQIVNEKRVTLPSEILRLLNLGVYEALHQAKDGALSDGGMDIALCTIDYKNYEIQYAGAKNPLIIISGGEMEFIKASIHGIGGGGMIAEIFDPIKREYINHVIPIKNDMSIYLFSDGYKDQFGGSPRKMFGIQKFKELLLRSRHLNMQIQKEIIASAHAEWKSNMTQIDDILVIGVKI